VHDVKRPASRLRKRRALPCDPDTCAAAAFSLTGRALFVSATAARHPSDQENSMASIDENILKAAKEIVVKFIECGRLSPSAFPEAFQNIYRTVEDTVKSGIKPAQKPPEQPPETKAHVTGQKSPGGKR